MDSRPDRTMTRRIAEIMRRPPVLAHVDATLCDAAKRMEEADVGAVFVADGDEVVGVLTDRDLVVRGLAEGEDGSSPIAAKGMTRHVVCVREDAPLATAAELMIRQRVRRLAVVDDQGGLVGAVALSDLARVPGLEEVAAAVLRMISAPTGAAKTPAPEDPTGGRARGAPLGTIHVYADRPRVRASRCAR